MPEDTKEWLVLSQELDYSARLLISMCLKNATDIATEQCSDLIELSKKIQGQELPLLNIVRILSEKNNNDREREEKESEIKRLEDRRDRLRSMVKMAELLTSDIDNKIKKYKIDL